MSFYRDTIRAARKEHKCDICEGVIKKGEKYHKKVGLNYDGEFFHCKECESCQPVIAEFCQTDYADDGYCGEWIQEWWRAEKCTACKNYFLPCKPSEWCKEYFHTGMESALECPERTEYGTCKAGDTCDDMTHYCRCENFSVAKSVAEVLQKGCRF